MSSLILAAMSTPAARLRVRLSQAMEEIRRLDEADLADPAVTVARLVATYLVPDTAYRVADLTIVGDRQYVERGPDWPVLWRSGRTALFEVSVSLVDHGLADWAGAVERDTRYRP